MSMYILGQNKHAKELVNLGFSDRLITTPEDCEIYLDHCKKNDMKFLKDSYGTMVHKNFNKFFKKSKNNRIFNKLGLTELGAIQQNRNIHRLMDHTNLLRSQIYKNVYVLTSSPYMILNQIVFEIIKEYPYNVYVINPNFLDYIAFVTHEHREWHPLSNLNYAFTEASQEQMLTINKAISEEIGVYNAFTLLKE